MSSVRHKDRDWSDAPNTYEFGTIRVLMDIRDELKAMNRVLQCSNTLRIPAYLKRIASNTAKPKKQKP